MEPGPSCAMLQASEGNVAMLRRAFTWIVRPGWPLARELAVVVTFALTYAGVRELTEGSTAAAIRNAEQLARLEGTLGFAWEHAVQSAVLGSKALVDLANWMYIWGHWPVIAVVAIVLFAVRRDRYRLLRNAVIISGLIGFVFFAFFPVAPPRLVDAGLVDTITRWSDSYRTLQPPRWTNQYAAMPSLHFGWNLLVGIVLFGTTRSLVVRAFSVLMPAAMAFAVVATANHWVIDVVAGAAVVLVGFLLARLAQTRAAMSQTPAPRTVAPQLLYWSESGPQGRIVGAQAVSRRAPRRERPRTPPPRGEPRRLSGGRRRSPLPRPRRGSAPEDDRAAADSVGSLATRESVRAETRPR